jgi:hypothetical protein
LRPFFEIASSLRCSQWRVVPVIASGAKQSRPKEAIEPDRKPL